MNKPLVMFLSILLIASSVTTVCAEQVFRAKANGPSGSLTCVNDQYEIRINLSANGAAPEETYFHYSAYYFPDNTTQHLLGHGYGYLPDKKFMGSISSGLNLELINSDIDWKYLTGEFYSLAVRFEPFSLDSWYPYGFKETISGTKEVETRLAITHTSGISTQMYTDGSLLLNDSIEMSKENADCRAFVSDNKGARIVIQNKQ